MTDFRALCAELVEKVEFTWGSGTPEDVEELLNRARAVLARWGTPNLSETRSSLEDALQPVPVSERLPGDQLCWWYEPDEDDDGTGYGGNWTLLRIRGCVSYYTHWLPAHALPLPTAND